MKVKKSKATRRLNKIKKIESRKKLRTSHKAGASDECIIAVNTINEPIEVRVEISPKHADEMTKAFWRFYE